MATQTQTTGVPPQYNGNQYQPQQPGVIIAPNTAVTNVQTVNTVSQRVVINDKALRTNSLLQLILGILIGIFGIVATCIYCNIYRGAGIWLGIAIVCIASVGIGGSSSTGSFSQKNCLIVTYHVSSIIIGLNAFTMGIMASIAASVEPYNYRYYPRSARVGIDITLAILLFAELIATIWAVVLTASATYCSRRETVVTTLPAVQYNNGVTSHNTQYASVNTAGPYPNQPYVHQHTQAATMTMHVDSYNTPGAYPPPYSTTVMKQTM